MSGDMKTYNVIVTRDLTESVGIDVVASSEEEARTIALGMGDKLSYEIDDGNAPQDPYITQCEEE